MSSLLRNFSSTTFSNALLTINDGIVFKGFCLISAKKHTGRSIRPVEYGRFRRKVHYPEEYTVGPLPVTRLGGRDPETGKKIISSIGGGLKYKYHWIDWKRVGPKEDVPPIEEKVILVKDAFERTAHIALVASGTKLKWIIATENMKPGDIIRTSQFIPHNPVVPREGDAYPLGAFPVGSIINNIEKYPGLGSWYCHAAGTSAKIARHLGDKVVVILPNKLEVALPKENMAVSGRVSNVDHNKTPIGSAQRNRELGNRPRTGLWHRKDGRFGRKIKPPKPLLVVSSKPKEEKEEINLTMFMKLNINPTNLY